MAALVSGCGKSPDRADSPSAKEPGSSPAENVTKPAPPTSPASETAKPAVAESPEVSPLHGGNQFSTNKLLSDELRKEDPLVEGWDSEAFHDQTNAQLKSLGELLSRGDWTSPESEKLAASLVAPDFASAPLRPDSLATAFEDETLVVRRGEGSLKADPLRGAARLLAALKELASPLANAKERRASFKEVHVNLEDGAARTTVLFQHSGRLDSGPIQINSRWSLNWTRESPPRLKGIAAERYEEILPGPQGGLAFVDVAPAILGKNRSYAEQLAQGFDYWRIRSDRALGSDLAGNQGISLGDVNGDDLDDVYVVQSGGLPNRLFIRQPGGLAQDATSDSGADYLDFSRCSLLIDLDNDGDQDLALGLNSGWLALENDGKGRFTRRAAWFCPATVYCLAAADFDNDGDLDLYACGRYPQGSLRDETRVQGLPVPYHDANNGGANSLWKNQGGWRFENVTEQVGLDANNRRFTLAASWEDFDNDGDQDLYVANDFGRNNLYRNDGGRFVDAAREEGVEDIGAGMSASWGDANNDGRMDLYVGNMFSSAGHRVAFQKQFMADLPPEQRAEFQRHARGNSLFLNRGTLPGADFDDVSLEAGVNMGRWAWGSMFADLNGDGREDLFVANGFITTEDTGDL